MTVTVHGNYDTDKTTTLRIINGHISERAYKAATHRAHIVEGDHLGASRLYPEHHRGDVVAIIS